MKNDFWIYEDDYAKTLHSDISFYDFKYGVIRLDKVKLFRGIWETKYTSEEVKEKFIWYAKSVNKNFVTADFLSWIESNEEEISCDVVYYPVEHAAVKLDSYRLDWSETTYEQTGYSGSGSIDEDSGKISVGITPTYTSHTEKKHEYVTPRYSTSNWSVFPDSALKSITTPQVEPLDQDSYISDMRVATSKELMNKLHNRALSVFKTSAQNMLYDHAAYTHKSVSDMKWHIEDLTITLYPVWRVKFVYKDTVFVSVFSHDLRDYRLAIPYKNTAIPQKRLNVDIARDHTTRAQKAMSKIRYPIIVSAFALFMLFINILEKVNIETSILGLSLSILGLMFLGLCHISSLKLNCYIPFIAEKYNFKRQNYERNRILSALYINLIDISIVCAILSSAMSLFVSFLLFFI